MQEIQTLNLISIRDQGLDEYWLQDYICNNPSCLGIGDLELVSKEKGSPYKTVRVNNFNKLDIMSSGST